jgi:predicted XRE-type DNA-binding protein
MPATAHSKTSRNVGSKNGKSKLNRDDIQHIRQLALAGNMQQKDIALLFGITQPLVSMIIHRHRWTHTP